MTDFKLKVILFGMLLGGVYLSGWYCHKQRGVHSVTPPNLPVQFSEGARNNGVSAAINSTGSEHAPNDGVPVVTEYTPPSVHIPFTKRRKAPTSLPIPIPEGKVDKVIRIDPGPSSATTGPIEVVVSTDGEVRVSPGQAAQVEVIQFRPKTAAMERRPGIGWRMGVTKVEPVAVLSLVNLKARVRVAVTVGWTGPGAGVLVRIGGSAKVGGWAFSAGPEYATSWKFKEPRMCGVFAITF